MNGKEDSFRFSYALFGCASSSIFECSILINEQRTLNRGTLAQMEPASFERHEQRYRRELEKAPKKNYSSLLFSCDIENYWKHKLCFYRNAALNRRMNSWEID